MLELGEDKKCWACRIAALTAVALALGLIFFLANVPKESEPLDRAAVPVPSRTLIPPEPERVDRATNVSFSTYSKEWPVGWQWIDPLEKDSPTRHDVRSGVLRVSLVGKKDLAGDARSSPRYMKAIEGDFQIETRVRFLPKENYQGAGLLIFADDANYVRFERCFGGTDGGGEGLRFERRVRGEMEPMATPDDLPYEGDEVDLKLVRRGPSLTAYWRYHEESEWREAGEASLPEAGSAVLAGVSASNTARPITAEFLFIKLLPVQP